MFNPLGEGEVVLCFYLNYYSYNSEQYKLDQFP